MQISPPAAPGFPSAPSFPISPKPLRGADGASAENPEPATPSLTRAAESSKCNVREVSETDCPAKFTRPVTLIESASTTISV